MHSTYHFSALMAYCTLLIGFDWFRWTTLTYKGAFSLIVVNKHQPNQTNGKSTHIILNTRNAFIFQLFCTEICRTSNKADITLFFNPQKFIASKMLKLCGWKSGTISLFNNSQKLVQILLKFSQQKVEGYEFVLAKFRWKRLFQSTKICDLSQYKSWTIWLYFTFVYKMR